MEYEAGLDHGDHDGSGGVAGTTRRLPGLRPPRARARAHARHPGAVPSGYLHPAEEDAPIGTTVAGESHAWFEAWLGAWMPYDPTNGAPVGSRHVVVAHGRDYGDVPPLKGVYHGGPAGDLDVKVELTRLA